MRLSICLPKKMRSIWLLSEHETSKETFIFLSLSITSVGITLEIKFHVPLIFHTLMHVRRQVLLRFSSFYLKWAVRRHSSIDVFYLTSHANLYPLKIIFFCSRGEWLVTSCCSSVESLLLFPLVVVVVDERERYITSLALFLSLFFFFFVSSFPS